MRTMCEHCGLEHRKPSRWFRLGRGFASHLRGMFVCSRECARDLARESELSIANDSGSRWEAGQLGFTALD